MNLSTRRALDTVIGPQGLWVPVKIHDLEGPLARMVARKGYVIRRMPILCRQDDPESAGKCQFTDRTHESVASLNGECSARHEVRLNVGQQQC